MIIAIAILIQARQGVFGTPIFPLVPPPPIGPLATGSFSLAFNDSFDV